MNTCKSLNIHAGGTTINNFIGLPGFIYEDEGFPLDRNLKMEFERTVRTVRKFDLVGTAD